MVCVINVMDVIDMINIHLRIMIESLESKILRCRMMYNELWKKLSNILLDDDLYEKRKLLYEFLIYCEHSYAIRKERLERLSSEYDREKEIDRGDSK